MVKKLAKRLNSSEHLVVKTSFVKLKKNKVHLQKGKIAQLYQTQT